MKHSIAFIHITSIFVIHPRTEMQFCNFISQIFNYQPDYLRISMDKCLKFCHFKPNDKFRATAKYCDWIILLWLNCFTYHEPDHCNNFFNRDSVTKHLSNYNICRPIYLSVIFHANVFERNNVCVSLDGTDDGTFVPLLNDPLLGPLRDRQGQAAAAEGEGHFVLQADGLGLEFQTHGGEHAWQKEGLI